MCIRDRVCLGRRVLIENFDVYLAESQKKHPDSSKAEQLFLAQAEYIKDVEDWLECQYADKAPIVFLDRFFLTTLVYYNAVPFHLESKSASIRLGREDLLVKLAENSFEVSSDKHIATYAQPAVQRLARFCVFTYYVLVLEKTSDLLNRVDERLLTQPWRKDLFEDDPQWTLLIQRAYFHFTRPYIHILHGPSPPEPVQVMFMISEQSTIEFLAEEYINYLE